MKMLKKAGALAIAGAMAMSLGTCAFAEEAATSPITIGKISVEDVLADGVKTGVKLVTVPYTAETLADSAQVTMLAEIGTANEVFAGNITYSTTAYIDQAAKGGSFSFKIDENRFIPEKNDDLDNALEAVYLNVKIGATGVSIPAVKGENVYTKVVEPDEPTLEETVEAKVKTSYAADKTTGLAYTDVFGLAGAAIVRMDITDLVTVQEGADAAELDLSANKVTIDGNPAYYTVYNGVTKLIALVDSSLPAHDIKIEADVNGTPRRYYGDPSQDASFTAGDISTAIAAYNTNGTITELTDITSLLVDMDGNVSFTAGDISATIAAYNSNGTSIPDVEK